MASICYRLNTLIFPPIEFPSHLTHTKQGYREKKLYPTKCSTCLVCYDKETLKLLSYPGCGVFLADKAPKHELGSGGDSGLLSFLPPIYSPYP